MKKLFLLILLMLLPFGAYAALFSDDNQAATINGNGSSYETVFTPNGQLTDRVVAAIKSAQNSVFIAAHDLNAKNITIALIDASRQKHDVKIILDNKQSHGNASESAFLMTLGLRPHINTTLENQFQDYMIIDGKDIFLGSIFAVAQQDDEKKSSSGLLIIHNAPELVKSYMENWTALWNASEEMQEKKK